MLASCSKRFLFAPKTYPTSNLIRKAMSTIVDAAEREQTVIENLKDVQKSFEECKTSPHARLVAISKYMPADDITYAMKTGQTHFGESYAADLEEKSKTLPANIQWHFIGHLQTNKCKIVAKIPNLFVVETIESEKKADALNKACVNVERKERLKVYVQVNTSGEESKSGCEPEKAYDVCRHIKENCPALELFGLMTIGMRDRDAANNPDFKKIVELKEDIKSRLELEHFEASFGMSGDFKEALKMGSDNVRVGSAIFGPRRMK